MKKIIGLTMALTMLMSTSAFAGDNLAVSDNAFGQVNLTLTANDSSEMEIIPMEVGDTILVDGVEMTLSEGEEPNTGGKNTRALTTLGFGDVGTSKTSASLKTYYGDIIYGSQGWRQTNKYWNSSFAKKVTIYNRTAYEFRTLHYTSGSSTVTSIVVPARSSRTVSVNSTKNQWFEGIVVGNNLYDSVEYYVE